MAKKSNKTEHVLKLITKNDDADQDDLFGLQQEFAGNSSSAPASKPDEPPKPEKQKRGKSSKTEEPTSVGEAEEKAAAPKKSAEKAEARKEKAKAAETLKETAEAAETVKKPEQAAAAAQTAAPVTAPSATVEENNGCSAILKERQQLINLAEILVKEKVALVMEKMKVCTCKTCVNDILALTLNALPPRYVTTDMGKQYLQLDIYKKQYETDILAALTKACVRVKASPRHVKE